MFTGIITDIGTVRSVEQRGDLVLVGDVADHRTTADLLGTHGHGEVLFVGMGGRRRNLRMQRPRGHGDEGGQGNCPPPREW